MKRLSCLSLSMVVALSLISCGGSATETHETSSDIVSNQSVVFQGSNANITYMGLSETPGISGCLYISLEIENDSNYECVYNLSDVYVNDSACNTGSGVPVVAQSGKFATGSFIVFTNLKVGDVSTVEFRVEIRDNKTLSLLETSDSISVVM